MVECYVPSSCVNSVSNQTEEPLKPCLDRNFGVKPNSYTQENESKGVNIISSDPAQAFDGYEAKKYNVASLELELGQGHDPGVRSSPFVKQCEGVRSKQGEMSSQITFTQSQRMYTHIKKFLDAQRLLRTKK